MVTPLAVADPESRSEDCMTRIDDTLHATISELTRAGKGILAADESQPTITKRFKALGIESTEESRRSYRSLLFTTQGAEQYLSGVILFEETLDQRADDGTPLTQVLTRRGILAGIKVDKGTTALPNAPGDLITQGLDGLVERLQAYKPHGVRFAKWREVYGITDRNPTPLGIEANAEVLARYAAVCQQEGIVPIVEPEVLIDGDHSIERCSEVSDAVLSAVFDALHRHKVILEGMVLKPSMVIAGKEHSAKSSPEEVAQATLDVLRRNVPAAVPTINFLSGGQSPEQATANLNAMNALYPKAPWVLSFSYARALQDPAMRAWGGRAENVPAAQKAFHQRLKMNAMARAGQWSPEMERAA
jgi:fructose-bisphosphate aldolase class I